MSVKDHEAFCFDSFQDRLLFWDDFAGDQLQDEWRSNGTGSAVVVDQQTGGIVRITTGAVAFNSHQIDWNTIRTLHIDKKTSLELRIKLTQTASVYVRLFLRFDFNNSVFFDYDSTVSANWQIRCRNGGADTTQDSGVAADTDYHIFRIECFPAEEVHFFIDGVETTNSPITTNIPDDAGDYLEPFFYIVTREDATKSMDIDYVYLRQDR